MIEPDLDLETDLSVDSIKRTEIAGVLVKRLGAGQLSGGVEAVSKLRTVRAITSWLAERLAVGSTPSRTPSAPPATASSVPAGRAPSRYVTRYLPCELSTVLTGTPLAGTRVLMLAGDPPTAPVADRLRSLGAEVTVLPADAEPDEVPADLGGTAVVHLGGWRAGDDDLDLPGGYGLIRSVLLRGPRVLVSAVPLAPGQGDAPAADRPRHVAVPAAGLRGLFRCIALEYPEQATRMVEIDPDAVDVAGVIAAEVVAAAQATEPARDGEPLVARHTAEGRGIARMVATPLGALAASGAGPAGVGAAEAAAIGLDSDAVVLLVGGARGITAGFTTLLAGAAGCRLELVGRSSPPGIAEDPRTAAAIDEAQLRQALIALGVRTPREIQRRVRQLLAEREIRATLADVRARGGSARYHQADVLDTGAVLKIVEQVFGEYGRLDGVVYAAGVIEDRLLAQKDPASFRRVFDTKVAGARSLLSALADLTVRPRFVSLFGSIAGVAGNRGQSDYAAANDALETLGSDWAERTGVRTVTVHWGPWAPAASHQGMVSPSLQQEFARRGIELIDQEEGHLALLRELAWGSPHQRAVVYTASGWSVPEEKGSLR